MRNRIAYILFAFLGISTAFAQTKSSNLKNWQEGKSPEIIGKQLSEKFLDSAHTFRGNPNDTTKADEIFYADVCTWLGGMWFAQKLQDKELFNRFENRFIPLMNEEKYLRPKSDHVDHSVFGSIPLELYMKTGNKDYLDLGLFYADTQWQLPQDAIEQEKAWHGLGYSWQTRVWIDDMFMITTIQSQAYKATGNAKYINRAANEMVFYLDTIQLSNGLFYHSPEAPFCWGRGNGWMAAGMAELLSILPKENPNHDRVMSSYKKMMQTLLKYQAKDGMWRQLINDKKSWKETSSTAMFTYAMIIGVKNGWLDEKKYGMATRKAWLTLLTYLNDNGDLKEVCKGTNIKNSKEHYMNRPRVVGDLHGHAPLLWCAAALLQ